jgi:hypothetical protein
MASSPDNAGPQGIGNMTRSLGERPATCAAHGDYVSRGTKLAFGRTAREIWSGCGFCFQTLNGHNDF